MHRKGKTEASFESPEFFHLKFIPLVHDKHIVSQKLLRPDLKYRCSPENTLKLQKSPQSPIFSPAYFNKNTSSNLTSETFKSSSTDLRQEVRPSQYYGSNLYSNYSSALKESAFHKHKSDFPINCSTRRILRDESKDLDTLRQRILKAKEKKQKLLDFLKGLKSN